MTQYIDKSTLSADIDKRKNLCEKIVLDLRTKENKDYYQGKAEAYSEMSELIDTLEVKEVDLDKEIKEQSDKYYSQCEKKLQKMDDNDNNLSFLSLDNFAKYFFELGLKAQKL